VNPDARCDFLEYGLQIAVGIPAWVADLRDRTGAGVHLHPLDVNLAGDEREGDDWIEALAGLVREWRATALVSDMGYWYHRHRESMWSRPPLMTETPRMCRDHAARVAQACGVPFRVENPPLEWMPGAPSLWRFLEEASDAPGVEICLDVSHLTQFAQNVHGERPSLPRTFPWHRVAELHLAGYITVEYLGARLHIDQHVAEIGDDQLDLVAEILERRGTNDGPDICLEMEPRAPDAYEAAAARLLAALA
jgi:uncharacterized protein (UPF0276 family)